MINIPEHGGNIYKYAQILKCEPVDILDFSANINPFGIPTGLKQHFINVLENAVNYPDPESKKLKSQLSNYLEVPENQICVGSGALDILLLILRAIKPKKLLIPAPTFMEYEKAAKEEGVSVYIYERDKNNDFKIDFDNLLMAIINNECDSVILCNPNNPTSTLNKAEDILPFLNKCSEHGIKVLIDEAFIELTRNPTENTVKQYVNAFDNLFVIRAFTKLFAIPGIRLGYLIASSENVKLIEAKQPSWPLNTLASEAGIVFETDKEYIIKTNVWLNTELDYLYENLTNIGALKVYPPETNFILCEITVKGWDSQRLTAELLKHRILIRNASNFTGLDSKFIRLAVKDRESNRCLIEALNKSLGGSLCPDL